MEQVWCLEVWGGNLPRREKSSEELMSAKKAKQQRRAARPRCGACGRIIHPGGHLHVYTLRDVPGYAAVYCCECIPAVRERMNLYDRAPNRTSPRV